MIHQKMQRRSGWCPTLQTPSQEAGSVPGYDRTSYNRAPGTLGLNAVGAAGNLLGRKRLWLAEAT